MHVLFEYKIDKNLESADDVISLYSGKSAIKFIEYIKYFEDTITYLLLLKKYHTTFSKKLIFSKQNNKKIEYFVILLSIESEIIHSFSKIMGYDNEYCLKKLFDYCKKHIACSNNKDNIPFVNYDIDMIDKIDGIINDIYIYYGYNIKTVRNRYYSHSSKEYYEPESMKRYMDNIKEDELFIQIGKIKDIINLYWKMFRCRELSFEITINNIVNF